MDTSDNTVSAGTTVTQQQLITPPTTSPIRINFPWLVLPKPNARNPNLVQPLGILEKPVILPGPRRRILQQDEQHELQRKIPETQEERFARLSPEEARRTTETNMHRQVLTMHNTFRLSFEEVVGQLNERFDRHLNAADVEWVWERYKNSSDYGGG